MGLRRQFANGLIKQIQERGEYPVEYPDSAIAIIEKYGDDAAYFKCLAAAAGEIVNHTEDCRTIDFFVPKKQYDKYMDLYLKWDKIKQERP